MDDLRPPLLVYAPKNYNLHKLILTIYETKLTEKMEKMKTEFS